MIIKGASRAGPSQLARHLQRADTNERVELIQLDSPTGDLHEALRDWQFISTGTRGTKGLYHANIDPDARYTMTADQWKIAVDRLEQELGLDGQPRAVVLHEKHGRQHIHVVWQRTDIDTMKLVPDSFNYLAHERASLALEQAFGHEIVPGKHAKRNRSKQPNMPKAAISHAEWQQGERTGIDSRVFKDTITALYKSCDIATAFQAALDERNLILAKGDRRDYVIVDDAGQVYSLARQIKGVTTKDLRAFMAGIDRETIPSVEEAKAIQRERQLAPAQAADEPEAAKGPPGLPDEEIEKLRALLKTRHDEQRRNLAEYHAAERAQTARIIDAEIQDTVAALDRQRKAALDRYDREHAAERRGLMKGIRDRFAPERAAAEAAGRVRDREAFLAALAKERENQIAALRAGQDRTLSDLDDRHAQQLREMETRQGDDLRRRIRDQEEAQRLLARIEEQRRLDEQRRRQDEKKHGPEPPGRAR